MTDSYIQVATDGSGKKVAAQEITRDDGTTIVDIQEVLGGALVSDTPASYQDGVIKPLSITAQGRLRVSTAASDLDQIWQYTFGDAGWTSDTPSVAKSAFPSAGDC